MKIHNSLKNILSFNFVLVAVLPLLVVGLLTLKFLTVNLSAEIQAKNDAIAKSLAGEVERFLTEPLSVLSQVENVLKSKSIIDISQINDYLAAMIQNYGFLDQIQILDEMGAIIHMAPLKGEIIGRNISHLPFYEETLKSKKSVRFQTQFVNPEAKPSLQVSKALGSGMMVGYVNLGSLESITAKGNSGKRSYALITDQEGKMILPSRTGLKSVQFDLGDINPNQQMKTEDETGNRGSNGKKDNIVSVARVPQTGWMVVFLQRAEEALAPLKRVRIFFGIGAILTAILAIAMALASIAKAVSPLSQLSSSARKVAGGNYHVNGSTPKYMELSELTDDFDFMVKAVKRREDALKASEERFRATFEQAAVGICHSAPKGKFTWVNQRFCEILGYSQAELMEMTFRDITHSDDLATDIDKARQLVAGIIENYGLEKRYIRKDGSTIWANLSVSLVRDASGAPNYFIGVIEDISARKQVENALQKSEATLKSIFLVAPIGIGLVSNRNINDVNERLCEMTGYVREELIGKNARILYPDQEEFEWVGREKYAQIEAQGTGTVETRWLRKDGQIIDVLLSSTPLDPDDLSTGVTFTALDITERKRAEAERDRLFNLSIDLLSIAGINGNFKQVNPAWTAALGWTEAELLQVPWLELLHPEDRERTSEAWKQLADGNPVYSLENRLRCRDGSYRWLSWNILPLPDEKLIFSVTRDITERKQVEENQKNLEEQLIHAQKMEAIGTLAGGIAHDFNNIISAIMGNAELAFLHDLPEDSPVRSSLEHVLKASYRAKDLVQQILMFSRQREEELRPVKVTPIVKETSKFLRASLPSTIEIKLDLEAESDMVLGDPTQIHQVLMNLCTNAAHAMHKEGGTLRMAMAAIPADLVNIDADPKSETELFLKLTISDTGHGMDRRTSERIFDPYFTTKPVGEGTGLGLAVVHGVVKSLGGHISVNSEPGKGSTFTIFIPLIKAQAVPKLETREPIPTGSERILFVDDEEPLAILGRRMLERLGYSVTVKTDSLEALEVFRSQTDDFDLVITDMTMPGMTGEKLAVELLRINPQIPIILCTGYSDLVSETMAKNLGIKEYILKPIVIRDMAKALRRALEPAE